MKNDKIIRIPNHFAFIDHDVYDFDNTLSVFDWSISSGRVLIDFSKCFSANYQAMTLFILYIWNLKSKGVRINFKFSDNFEGASKMWKLMGAKSWFHVLNNENNNFNGTEFKPLVAIRNQDDFASAVSKAESYVKGFNVEYEKTLRYVLTELLYNTLEHGKSYVTTREECTRIPSVTQFAWYVNRNELQFIIADTGVGIKKHLEQTYPAFENHAAAISYSVRPQVSGTFASTDPYKSKDNAGVGLYLSTNIVRRLNADMHIVSGDGVLHISPRDITVNSFRSYWPGTFVVVKVKINDDMLFSLHNLMSEFRESAMREIYLQDDRYEQEYLVVNVYNFFGSYAEDKDAAIKFRDKYIINSINENKKIIIDFNNVVSAPHSFLSALLATPIKLLGMGSYKRIKITNSEPEIRETIDYILDENT